MVVVNHTFSHYSYQMKMIISKKNEDDNIQETYIQKRASVLYGIDKGKKVRRSHLNPDIITLYKEYLGEYGSPKAHKLLHTTYNAEREKYPDINPEE